MNHSAKLRSVVKKCVFFLFNFSRRVIAVLR